MSDGSYASYLISSFNSNILCRLLTISFVNLKSFSLVINPKIPKVADRLNIKSEVFVNENWKHNSLFENSELSMLFIINPVRAIETVNNRLIEKVSKSNCLLCQNKNLVLSSLIDDFSKSFKADFTFVPKYFRLAIIGNVIIIQYSI